MKVFVVRHESGHNVYCPTKEQALKTLSICLTEQSRRRPDDREEVTVSVEKISKKEFDAMDDVPDGEC